LVPGLVQQVELPPGNHLHGMVYYLDGELRAYAELRFGPRDLCPALYPSDAEQVGDMLVELLAIYPTGKPACVPVHTLVPILIEHSLRRWEPTPARIKRYW
jgi:hypothetical protein